LQICQEPQEQDGPALTWLAWLMFIALMAALVSLLTRCVLHSQGGGGRVRDERGIEDIALKGEA
jgi:hypothetical protein